MSDTKSRPQPATEEPKASPQVRRTREAVLKATHGLMFEGGIGGVTIDEVSRRSGVAKTTIYRHWPSRSALLLTACSQLGPRPQAPDTGRLKRDLTVLAERLAEQLATAKWPAILPSIADAAERNPDIAKLHAQLKAGFAAPYSEVVAGAKRRGEAPARTDAALVTASIIGPLFYRRWFSREPIDARFVREVVASALARIDGHPARKDQKR